MELRKLVSLKEYSHYQIGGRADFFMSLAGEDDFKEISKIIRDTGVETSFVLGGGTNILFSDNDYKGLVIKPEINTLEREKSVVRVGAGVMIDDLLDFCVEEELRGLEWAGGLPGTVGGAVRGNAGAFKGEVKDGVKRVRSFDLESNKFVERDGLDCKFGYRDSIYKHNEEIISEIWLELEKGERKNIEEVIKEKKDYRKERQPLEYPNIGSIFKNVPLELVPEEFRELVKSVVKTDPFLVVPAAFLIHEVGLKGEREGGAMVSVKHPNFIINCKEAKSRDVKKLIEKVKEKVYKKFKINLETEIVLL